MVVVDPLKGPSSALIMCSENFKFNQNYVNISRPKIISYPPLAESSTCHFHVRIFFALSVGKVQSTLTLRLAVIFLACVCHFITDYFQDVFFN